MTRIDFYFNVPNKLSLISNLVASTLIKHRQVTIFEADEHQANKVSEALWYGKSEDFLPTLLANHELAKHAPVLVSWHESQLIQDDMLINLTVKEPKFFSRFTQLVEVVSVDEEDKKLARERYKFYRDRGYEIKNIDFTELNTNHVS
jgi:DNA polymerase-3 subunit chi